MTKCLKTLFLFQRVIVIKKAGKICNLAVNIILEKLVIFLTKNIREIICFANTDNYNLFSVTIVSLCITFSFLAILMAAVFYK